jgi:GGDEF domain-containing protein
LSALCRHGGRIRFASLVALRQPAGPGYLEVVADPVPSLARIEGRLGIPVRVRDADDRRLYASNTWPPPNAMHDALVAEHALTGLRNEAVLKVAALRDIADLRVALRETRVLVMTVAVAVTVLGMLIASWFLERTALRPLNTLTAHLRRVSHDQNRLAESVDVRGIAEIRELADDFNHMARELTRLYGSLEHLAFTDPLTNLPNRARFRDSLEEAARRHAQAQTPFALLLMDLDRFKGVNDTLGHQIGDLLLQEVSVRLKSVLRGSDTIARLDNETILELDSKLVARLGGDEFAAILPRVGDVESAGAIARKLLLVMQEPFKIRGHVISIGISIGIALFPQHGEDTDTLIQRADAAMYYAKNNQTGLAFPIAMQQTRLI